MSTSVSSNQKNGIWSSIPFVGSPRRRSIPLPYNHANGDKKSNAAWDPFEKTDRHTSSGASQSNHRILEKVQNAWMTQSQRARWLKTGGIVAFVLFVFYYISGLSSTSTRPIGGTYLFRESG